MKIFLSNFDRWPQSPFFPTHTHTHIQCTLCETLQLNDLKHVYRMSCKTQSVYFAKWKDLVSVVLIQTQDDTSPGRGIECSSEGLRTGFFDTFSKKKGVLISMLSTSQYCEDIYWNVDKNSIVFNMSFSSIFFIYSVRLSISFISLLSMAVFRTCKHRSNLLSQNCTLKMFKCDGFFFF